MKMLSFICTAVAVTLVTLPAQAWEDPIGDIHPQVKVEDGKFVVTSAEHIPYDGEWPTADEPRFINTRVFDKRGRLVSKKREWLSAEEMQNRYWPKKLPEVGVVFELRGDDGTVWMIPRDAANEKHVKPFIISQRNGVQTRHPIEWKHQDRMWVDDAMIVGENLYLLSGFIAKFGDEPPSAEDEMFIAQFGEEPPYVHEGIFKFSLETFEQLAHMYFPDDDFSRISNMVAHDGRVYVAFRSDCFLGLEIVLASWDGVSETFERRVLTQWVDWNTSLSLANIDDNALLAWHYGDGTFAQVQTLAFSLSHGRNSYGIVYHFLWFLPLLLGLAWPVVSTLRGGRVWLWALLSYPLLVASVLFFTFLPMTQYLVGFDTTLNFFAFIPSIDYAHIIVGFGWMLSIPIVLVAWFVRRLVKKLRETAMP